MTLAAGTRLGPYEVLGSLGAGGMGEVYRARDTRLDRDVAFKVLPDEVAKDAHALARFEHEAKAVAALSHPNILALFDVGEAGGVHYAVTELLEGETLRSALARGLLPRKRVLDIATQVADALAAAHEKGIVHRDVKPENVFLTKDGRAKLLDFGIARQRPPTAPADTITPTVTALSEPGVLVGTVAYMSPEQARGEAVDFRSDQFSLGTLLYEMFAGRRPFGGGSPTETLAAILRDEPEPLEKLAPAVPAPVRWIVERCLAKEAGERYDSTRDLGKELENCRDHLADIGAGVSAPLVAAGARPPRGLVIAAIAGVALVAILAVLIARRKSAVSHGSSTSPQGGPLRIVVLPFENLGSPDDSYFASGMTEEITSRLANVRILAVISRTTATEYNRKGKTVEQIGKDLGVSHVLEGSVRWDRSGGGPGRVRITPQLIRVSDDTHLWSERYDRQLADIFAIQGDVAEGVVRALNLTLAPVESSAMRQLPTKDLEAYDLYLRALELEKRLKPNAITEQIQLTSAAVERDPQFAEALALLATTRIHNYWAHYDRRESELVRAGFEAERSVALRPDSAETHMALGYYHYQGRLDYEAAIAEFNKALAIQPNDARVRAAIGYVWRRQGKMDEAETQLRKAIDAEPRNGQFYYNLAITQLLLRRYQDTIQTARFAASLSPTLSDNYSLLALAHVLWNGDMAAAEQVLKKAAEVPLLEDPGGLVDYYSVRISLIARDWEGALRRLNAQRNEIFTDENKYIPLSMLRAEVFSYMVRRAPARESYEEARRLLVAKIAETPDDARLHSSLGIALAGLGRAAEAVREGELGVALMPPTRDVVRGVRRVEDMARIYATVGDQDAALQQLDYLLSHASQISVPLLKLDPRWNPLRKNPRFRALLAKYEVKH
jgi:serine/threonine protein kinase/Flp pilus assembly protein TadD